MSNVARDNSHDNIFKAMKDITFEKTVSHQCGVTMSDSVEARAIRSHRPWAVDPRDIAQPRILRNVA